MPTVKELEAFIAVVESGSFQGSARRLNAPPPAISKRISELESELGVRLFERSTRHCHITARGRALTAYAHRVLGDIGEIQRTIGKRSSLVGHIRLGVVETIAFTKLPELLRRFSVDLTKLASNTFCESKGWIAAGWCTDLLLKFDGFGLKRPLRARRSSTFSLSLERSSPFAICPTGCAAQRTSPDRRGPNRPQG